ncbi:hypothetical protein LNP26_23480 [Klebsiella variicola subsp. variicola]|nr:hypothetical protein [Klebsiella variicola subsp. variicola]
MTGRASVSAPPPAAPCWPIIFRLILSTFSPTWKSYASPTLAGPFAQLTTAAIDAGIARAALDDTVAFVRHSARPWIDAGVAQASDDPLTIYHIGQLDSRLAAADALLERAGRVLDRYKNDLSEEHVAEASLAVARAKIWTTEVALEAASRLFELGALAPPVSRSTSTATGAMPGCTPCTTRFAGSISCLATGC